MDHTKTENKPNLAHATPFSKLILDNDEATKRRNSLLEMGNRGSTRSHLLPLVAERNSFLLKELYSGILLYEA